MAIRQVNLDEIRHYYEKCPKTFEWIQDKARWEHITRGKVVNDYRDYIIEIAKKNNEPVYKEKV